MTGSAATLPAHDPPRLVLVGAGHAHLQTIQRIGAFTRRGFAVTVIAPENFWYSGLATGVLGGHYAAKQDQVDVEMLTRRGGGDLIRASVLSIDPARRRLHLASGPVPYDLLSLNLGSETKPLPGEDDRVFPIKPLHHLWRLRQYLEAASAASRRIRVVIAGGGASGCEIAANVRALAGPGADIVVAASGCKVAASLAPGAARALARALRSRAIAVRTDTTISDVTGGVALTGGGERIPFDCLVNATGLHAPAILRESGLPVTDRGELMVDEYLRARGDARIFGGGDCIHFGPHGLAKVGVYAVRQSPILFHNLLATLEGKPLLRFRPQRSFLLILNLGGGKGLACYQNFFWQSRTAFWLKDWIDRRFLARYQTAPRQDR